MTFMLFNKSPYEKITRTIQKASTIQQLRKIRSEILELVRTSIDEGLNVKEIAKINSLFSDEIVIKLNKFAIKLLGRSPVKYAFIVLGSEGREEQTLKTDQDNAIVYEDVNDKGEAQAYFIKLAELVCDWLHELGYPYCPGDMMAKNSEWCQSFSVWQNYFHQWIVEADPEKLLRAEVFFDFRCVYGETKLTKKLRRGLFADVHNRTPFYFQLVKVMLLHKVPLNIFGNIKLEKDGEHQSELSIKKALRPIVEFARLYSLEHGITCTNTFERLEALYKKQILNETDYRDLLRVLDYLFRLRLNQQSKDIKGHSAPDNYINPRDLPKLDRAMLKESFHTIETFQKKAALDFAGPMG
jgi:CBS domain-containing protein